MFIDPLRLIDQTVEHLQILDEMFREEIAVQSHRPELTVDACLCLDAHVAISALLPRLRAARATQQHSSARQPLLCENCD